MIMCVGSDALRKHTGVLMALDNVSTLQSRKQTNKQTNGTTHRDITLRSVPTSLDVLVTTAKVANTSSYSYLQQLLN